MKPYPHKCPKCRETTFAPANVSRVVTYRYDGKDHMFDIDDLPVLKCGRCQYEADTNDTEDRILSVMRSHLDLLSPSEIAENRERLQLTQRELARRIGTSEESICRWERGLVVQSRAMNKLLQVFFFIGAARNSLQADAFRRPVGAGAEG
ncbi:MAG TPA: type II TA system antitoxin MqsA family protein [Phycisphaerae bacterium]|nr:type II TA system antitoxin MqsA family protein [Phycisphaerae bacterium]